MRILFVFLTLVQWSVYTLGGVVFIIPPEQTIEESSCSAMSSYSNDSPICGDDTQSCSPATPDCSDQDDKGCCNSIICLSICYPLQTGPIQEVLDIPNGIDLIPSENATYLVWIPNPYLEIFSPPPDQLLYCS